MKNTLTHEYPVLVTSWSFPNPKGWKKTLSRQGIPVYFRETEAQKNILTYLKVGTGSLQPTDLLSNFSWIHGQCPHKLILKQELGQGVDHFLWTFSFASMCVSWWLSGSQTLRCETQGKICLFQCVPLEEEGTWTVIADIFSFTQCEGPRYSYSWRRQHIILCLSSSHPGRKENKALNGK